jgi:hypothetical protein
MRRVAGVERRSRTRNRRSRERGDPAAFPARGEDIVTGRYRKRQATNTSSGSIAIPAYAM